LKVAGFGLKAISAPYSSYKEREVLSKILKRTETAKSVPEVEKTASEQVESFAQKAVTDTMSKNAREQSNAGVVVKVTRIYDGVGVHDREDECEWCLRRCCVDKPYSEAKKIGAFERHPGCHCEISYSTGKRTLIQTDWTKNEWTETQDRDILEARKTYGLDEERKTPEQRIAEAERLETLSANGSTVQYERYNGLIEDGSSEVHENSREADNVDSDGINRSDHIAQIASQYEINAGEMSAEKIAELHDEAVRQKSLFDYIGRNGSNMAIMELDNELFYSNSKVKYLTDVVTQSFRGDKSRLIRLSNPRLFTTEYIDGYDRYVDTEAKLFEYAARKVNDGRKHILYMLSEKSMCESCHGVQDSFIQAFPNVSVNVVSLKGEISIKSRRKNILLEMGVKRLRSERK
jgi:hypothetical protein